MDQYQSNFNSFVRRHIGSYEQEAALLQHIGLKQIDELIDKTIPQNIRLKEPLELPPPLTESALLQELKELSLQNQVFRSFIGQGYYGTHTPAVIQRNIFENPNWYTPYTPYQAEISQGRLESLLNFQTMVSDLTGLPIANASLLDEGTAAAEAMLMLYRFAQANGQDSRHRFFIDNRLFPQTLDVLLTRAEPLGIEWVLGKWEEAQIDEQYFGAIVQYPDQEGALHDYRSFINQVHRAGAHVVMATDLLALTLLLPPGEMDADVAVGSSQRFGVPMGYGGPHAAFFAAKDIFKRYIPGRIIGVSVDSQGNQALRMALQTREQHIKREKATSNICTAQALLANMAAMYAVYHGPEGLKNIALRVHQLTAALYEGLRELGITCDHAYFFDTLWISTLQSREIRRIAEAYRINFRYADPQHIGISLDETTTPADVLDILHIFALATGQDRAQFVLVEEAFTPHLPEQLIRVSAFLTHPVFRQYHTETRLMRYIHKLESKDIALTQSMIPLGSCTMKLNAAAEMLPLSWQHWSQIHPFAPPEQARGYQELIKRLGSYLCAITGLEACSFQPNSGAQGEYTGLLTIRRYFAARGESQRRIMLIPLSAHGTNPASAVMAGMQVVTVKTRDNGYIDLEDFREKAYQYRNELAGVMITYPSTYGIFEEHIQSLCEIVHECGGLVYLDGANMNAQIGLTSPAAIGADICHLNLHKTFAIPHGGGGPGMGPVCAKAFLAPYLPDHYLFHQINYQQEGNGHATTRHHAVSSAPYGSPYILIISYAYIRLLGADGLRQVSEHAILHANYMKARLEKAFPVLFTGEHHTCGHEFIIDLRPFRQSTNIEVEDVAKRLMDFGFHAPTISFPVPGTMMIEPTESEDQEEMDRFCEALLEIHKEIEAIAAGKMDRQDNPLKNAPHTHEMVVADSWSHPYSREKAAYPLPFVRHQKYWPPVSRINQTLGDRHLICTCPPLSAYVDQEQAS
ncbi:MAG: aminomethyl-transferring glycine dehydrogenase [Thermoflavifilum sp.]|nr:aminomethyl-transferring glycine dehydrogenase [Thermoflavifilum sp.]